MQIEDSVYEGTAVEIVERLRTEQTLEPDEFSDTDSYLRFLQDNVSRMAGMACSMLEGGMEDRARAMLGYLADAGGLLMLEDG